VASQVLNNFINGEYSAATVGQTSAVIDPSTGKDLSVYGFEDYTRIKHVMSYLGG